MKKDKHRLRRQFFLLLIFAFCFLPHPAQTLAPNGPGKDAQWATAGKQGVGTSASLKSKVWFTLAQGVMTEVYYPDVTVANVHLLQFVVVNPKTKKVETEQDDATHQVRVTRLDSLSFQQINTAKSGEWKITKTYATDPEKDSVLIDVKFETKNENLNLYVYYDPSLGNSGMHDSAHSPVASAEFEKERIDFNGKRTYQKEVLNRGILAEDENGEDNKIASVALFSSNISELTNGFYGVSDGLDQLRKFGKIQERFYANKGNAVQMAKIDDPKSFTVSLGFANDDYNLISALGNAEDSLNKGFAKVLSEYEKGWSDYVAKLPKVEPKYQAQFNMAAMILKAHEDKTVRGANIASLTVPWGGGANANENNIGGYHLIWSRDLYQVATAFMALGDKEAALRALDFLFRVQQKPDGSFPQNSYLDGKPFWGSLQLDEVAFPLILAYQLERNDKQTYEKHIKLAADFIVKNGPVTPQERWEEESGYSPSTIAAEIAGLVCAADIAQKNGDNESANRWLKTADEWQANIEKWTVTKTGKYSKEPYYLRITQGKPDSGEKIELNNGAGFFDERDIVDAGFLELVRLGIKPADDKIIQNSLKVIDQVIRVKTPNGDGFYRYNHDGYGEMDDGRRWNWDGKYTGKGRLWALLSGERGQYELARGYDYLNDPLADGDIPDFGKYLLKKAENRLETMQKFANDGLMIPEQIWDSPNVPKNFDKQFVPELKFGEGTGSATPLAWSMAQFIRLAVNLKEGRNLDTPKVVYERYVLGKKSEGSSVSDQNFSVQLDSSEENTPIRGKEVYKKAEDGCDFIQNFIPKGSFVSSVGAKQPTPRQFLAKGKDETLMEFHYSGEAKSVEVVAEFTGWKPCNLMLQGSAASKGRILKFPNSARVEYKLIVDGKWITDPLNPNKVDNGVGGENSFFTMPDYKPTDWNKIDGKQIYFQTFTEEINSKIYGRRKVEVFSPFGSQFDALPVLYLLDGTDYIKRTNAVLQIQNLMYAGKLKPLRVVFIDYHDRMKEYWANDDFAKFLAEEVVPFIDDKYNTIKLRDGRAVMGASLGGITAVNIGLKYPTVFGRIGGQSVSWWIDNERIVKELEKLDGETKFKIYIDDGTLEGVEDSHKAVEILRKKGFDVTYIEGEAGHNWTAWRDRLAEAFIAIWK
jgi:glucoamylase